MKAWIHNGKVVHPILAGEADPRLGKIYDIGTYDVDLLCDAEEMVEIAKRNLRRVHERLVRKIDRLETEVIDDAKWNSLIRED